jgi:hypothetical protein
VDAFLWEHLMTPAPKPRVVFELIPGSGSATTELAVHGGMHDATVLSRLLASSKPFTGLVMSIAVNHLDLPAAENAGLLRSISNFLVGLLRESDFTCSTAKDEFLIICPGLQGLEAHRRLSLIAEQLWDYQLRTFGGSQVLFSWGAVDVKRERLVDAVSAATERMYQTRRTREAVSASTSNLRRKAV